MALQVWLPLNGNLDNQGLMSITTTNNNGTVNTSGKIGSCYSFTNATNSNIKVDVDSTAFNSKSISIAFWFYPIAYGSNYASLIAMADGAAYNNVRFGITTNKANTSLTWCVSSGSSSTQLGINTSYVPINTWTHLAVTYNGTNMCWYINGELINTGTSTVSISYLSSFYISRWGSASVAGLSSRFNDVRIYDHALSPKEVKEISKGLVLHYKLDGNMGSNPNLLLKSNVYKSTTGYAIADYYFVTGNAPVSGEQYTVQLKGKLNPNKSYFGLYNSGGSVPCVTLYPENEKDGIYTKTFNWVTSSASNTFLRVYHMPSSVTGQASQIEWIKLEKGGVATPWCPNSTETGATDSIVFDYSGYKYNGSINGTLSFNSDSPRYILDTVFDGAESAVSNNSFSMANDKMSVSCWVYLSNIPSGHYAYLVSVSPGGGAAAVDQQIALVIYPNKLLYACGNGSETSTGYSFPLSTWVHIVETINGSTTKTYINGALYNTYTNANSPKVASKIAVGARADSPIVTSNFILNGKMSDVRIYASVLSDSDIKELYETGQSVDNKGNIYAYEFKE